MHTTNKRRVKRQNLQRAGLLTQLVSGHTPYGRIEPLPRPIAEKVIAEKLDLWAWTQGRVQFLTPDEIRAAARCGLHSWIEAAVNGSDSADPFFTINGGWNAILEVFPSALSIQTRCANSRDGGHSCWAYGSVFTPPRPRVSPIESTAAAAASINPCRRQLRGKESKMYTIQNFKTKKALKAALAAGQSIRVYSPSPFPCPANGPVTLEGPHYPEPHKWYAQAVLKDGIIVKVS